MGIERADTAPARGRGIGIERVDTTPIRADTAPTRGRGIGIGRVPTKRSRIVGLEVFIPENGLTTYNPGLPSNKILQTSSGWPISSANVTGDLGFKPRTGVGWKGKKAMTSNQLEVMRDETRVNKRQKKASSQSKEQWK
ncbi:hypothetical protein H5410_027818 [Solanum commersonii]|uniref:Uncharacterized protein n=1 Tax=Solanum commersonii TaxID=4109 RepID=A0A9J5Z5M1_SOLCO|nr:hypothetical protein H5410_027818 [Solanum commersonii]